MPSSPSHKRPVVSQFNKLELGRPLGVLTTPQCPLNLSPPRGRAMTPHLTRSLSDRVPIHTLQDRNAPAPGRENLASSCALDHHPHLTSLTPSLKPDSVNHHIIDSTVIAQGIIPFASCIQQELSRMRGQYTTHMYMWPRSEPSQTPETVGRNACVPALEVHRLTVCGLGTIIMGRDVFLTIQRFIGFDHG